jgi:hypothetical protein
MEIGSLLKKRQSFRLIVDQFLFRFQLMTDLFHWSDLLRARSCESARRFVRRRFDEIRPFPIGKI